MRFVKLIVMLLVFVGCNKNKVLKESNLNATKTLKTTAVESFDEFNKKFHSDSVFQVSRVDFPIDGKHVSGFQQYSWTQKNWQFQAIPVSDQTEIGEYQHSLEKTDTLIIEKFWIPDSGFEVERQFKLIKNQWFLIYYNDINL